MDIRDRGQRELLDDKSMPKVHLENWKTFYDQIESKNDQFAELFRKTIPRKEDLVEEQKNIKARIALLGRLKGDEAIDKMLAEQEKLSTKIQKHIDRSPEPYFDRVKDVVYQILGVFGKKDDDNMQLRSQYFDLLVQSDLLSLKGITLEQFSYNPAIAVTEFLKKNPEIKIVSIGCGHLLNEESGICTHYVDQMFHSKAMNMNINHGLDPDIIADMNDLRVWNAIPEGYLSEVHDHTNMTLLIENPLTIAAIHKTLQPGGKLFVLYPPDDKGKSILQEQGFVQEGDRGSLFKSVPKNSESTTFFSLDCTIL